MTTTTRDAQTERFLDALFAGDLDGFFADDAPAAPARLATFADRNDVADRYRQQVWIDNGQLRVVQYRPYSIQVGATAGGGHERRVTLNIKATATRSRMPGCLANHGHKHRVFAALDAWQAAGKPATFTYEF